MLDGDSFLKHFYNTLSPKVVITPLDRPAGFRETVSANGDRVCIDQWLYTSALVRDGEKSLEVQYIKPMAQALAECVNWNIRARYLCRIARRDQLNKNLGVILSFRDDGSPIDKLLVGGGIELPEVGSIIRIGDQRYGVIQAVAGERGGAEILLDRYITSKISIGQPVRGGLENALIKFDRKIDKVLNPSLNVEDVVVTLHSSPMPVNPSQDAVYRYYEFKRLSLRSVSTESPDGTQVAMDLLFGISIQSAK